MIYTIVQSLSYLYFKLFFSLKRYGYENVPKDGAFLLAANHASYFDPPIIGSAIPRQICYFARKTLFKGFMGWLLPHLKTIPVDRDGDSDITALKRVLKELQNGEGLVVFPEGTRSPDGELQPNRKGVGMIACRSQVPVVPVRIYGSFQAFGRNQKKPKLGVPMTVIFGKPLYPNDFDVGKETRERYQIASDRIMDAIRKLENPRAQN